MSSARELGSFEEIRELIARLPGPDLAAASKAADLESQLTKPPGSLGRLEEISAWLCRWQARHPPRVERLRIAVFAANHGVVRKGVSAYPQDVTAQMVRNFIAGGAAINQLAALVDSDLRVYELALEEPSQDFTEAPALTEEECARAIAYGMTAVEEGIDLIALGEMGIGNTTAAAALCHGLFGGRVEDWIGRGTGVDDAGLARKIAAVEAGVAQNRELLKNPFHVLRALGGLELAAICGAILAARMAHTPVILDGYACCAAASVLNAFDGHLLDHCLVGHCSAEPGHARLLERIGKKPLLDLGMRLGEGSGAALAMALVKAAAACHNGMASFTEAGVSGPAQ